MPQNKLLLILQRYYFESESQPTFTLKAENQSCCLSYKDTILKANHSTKSNLTLQFFAVAYPTKILFWKRITANRSHKHLYWGCCLSYKDTILKANHSCSRGIKIQLEAVAYPTKILFWKRITALNRAQRYYLSCCLSYKDTILKANHSQLMKHII